MNELMKFHNFFMCREYLCDTLGQHTNHLH